MKKISRFCAAAVFTMLLTLPVWASGPMDTPQTPVPVPSPTTVTAEETTDAADQSAPDGTLAEVVLNVFEAVISIL